MTIQIANRLSQINEPQTIAMAKLSRELAAKGHDVISLSLGEPDFQTPDHIKEAAVEAMNKGFTFYTPVAGSVELRQAICQKLKRDNQLDYSPDQIVVSTGAKHSLMNVVMATINPGDEVIIPTPYWVSYSEMVKLMGGIPVFINADVAQEYKINSQQLEAAITPRTKMFIFSSPCNPSGSVYTQQELEQLVSIFIRYPQILVVSDEIYEYINFTGKHCSIASFEPMKDRVVVVNGMSKGFAMTGWRIGYIAAPKTIAVACEKIQGQYTSGTNSIAQYASAVALQSSLDESMKMAAVYKQRRDLVVAALNQIPGLKCNTPQGAFYAFPDVSEYFGKTYQGNTIRTATDLCMYLLHHAHVSMVTGEAFGAPNCVRISFATSTERLTEAMQRITHAFKQLINE
jgi:aspartate aminotransferase